MTDRAFIPVHWAFLASWALAIVGLGVLVVFLAAGADNVWLVVAQVAIFAVQLVFMGIGIGAMLRRALGG